MKQVVLFVMTERKLQKHIPTISAVTIKGDILKVAVIVYVFC